MTTMTDGTVTFSQPPARQTEQHRDGRPAPAKPPVRPLATLSRDQILDATAACLRDQGYDGTTIRRIAARLGCAVGTIYRYFEDKRTLLDAVCQRRFEPVIEELDGGASVNESAGAYARAATEQPELYRLMFWLASVGHTEYGAGMPSTVHTIIERWAAPLAGKANAQRFWAQLHGTIMLGLPTDQIALGHLSVTLPEPLRGQAVSDANVDHQPQEGIPEVVVVSPPRAPAPQQPEDVTLL